LRCWEGILFLAVPEGLPSANAVEALKKTKPKKPPTERGQPIKELLVQLLIQLLDLLAERRLRNMFATDEPAAVGLPLRRL
jgi:hypothetical protein